MKSIAFGIALLGMPAIAMAQTGTKTPVAVLNDPATNTFEGDPHYGQWLQDFFLV